MVNTGGVLSGAKFSIQKQKMNSDDKYVNDGAAKTLTTGSDGIIKITEEDVPITASNYNVKVRYIIEEKDAPSIQHMKLSKKIYIYVYKWLDTANNRYAVSDIYVYYGSNLLTAGKDLLPVKYEIQKR